MLVLRVPVAVVIYARGLALDRREEQRLTPGFRPMSDHGILATHAKANNLQASPPEKMNDRQCSPR
jgi:hypothetical protein